MDKMKSITIACVVLAFLAGCLAAEAQDRILMDQELSVLRGDFKEVHFLVPDELANGEFQGEFKCTGGFNDDITFLALTQAAYVRWFSHYDSKPEVKLEKKKDGTFRFPAKPGETYYFVFDNFFSSVSNKKIKFTVKLLGKSH